MRSSTGFRIRDRVTREYNAHAQQPGRAGIEIGVANRAKCNLLGAVSEVVANGQCVGYADNDRRID